MASPNTTTSIKIHEQCNVAPTPPANQLSLPLTFFDLFFLRFHPVERLFFYTLHSPPSLFFHQVLPKLKASLSHTLHHFLPLAGNIVWPSHSDNPFVQYIPGDGVSVVVAESDADFHTITNNSPREALESRSFVPHLDSSNSHASVLSIQITLFPNHGFSIGTSTHHAVLDGKSSTLFIKAWASLCQSSEESPTLGPELKPFFDREVIKDPKDLGITLVDNWTDILSKVPLDENDQSRCLKIPHFETKILEDSVRATFDLTLADLEKVKKMVLSKWDTVDDKQEESTSSPSKPRPTLSSFVLTCGYVLVCIAKAVHGVQNEKQKFGFGIAVDCRKRLEPPIPDNYFGNCAWGTMIDADPRDFIKEDGVVLVAKSIHSKIKAVEDEGIFKVDKLGFGCFPALISEGIQVIPLSGSNKFGVYGIDFGWGKPTKVEIVSLDRAGLAIGMAENKDIEKGGTQVGLILNKHVMDLFSTLFHAGLCKD